MFLQKTGKGFLSLSCQIKSGLFFAVSDYFFFVFELDGETLHWMKPWVVGTRC